jgi:hypothetical protein
MGLVILGGNRLSSPSLVINVAHNAPPKKCLKKSERASSSP